MIRREEAGVSAVKNGPYLLSCNGGKLQEEVIDRSPVFGRVKGDRTGTHVPVKQGVPPWIWVQS